MRKRVFVLPTAVVAAAIVGCGSDPRHASAPAQPNHRTTLTWSESPAAPKTLLMVRRIRYEGATLRTMYVHRDGSVDVDVPNGGAGASKYAGRIAPRTFATVQRQVASIPWGHLSRRKAVLDASGGYWIVRHRGNEHVAMSDGMSKDLLPLLRTINGVLNGGLQDKHVLHRFGRL